MSIVTNSEAIEMKSQLEYLQEMLEERDYEIQLHINIQTDLQNKNIELVESIVTSKHLSDKEILDLAPSLTQDRLNELRKSQVSPGLPPKRQKPKKGQYQKKSKIGENRVPQTPGIPLRPVGKQNGGPYNPLGVLYSNQNEISFRKQDLPGEVSEGNRHRKFPTQEFVGMSGGWDGPREAQNINYKEQGKQVKQVKQVKCEVVKNLQVSKKMDKGSEYTTVSFRNEFSFLTTKHQVGLTVVEAGKHIYSSRGAKSKSKTVKN